MKPLTQFMATYRKMIIRILVILAVAYAIICVCFCMADLSTIVNHFYKVFIPLLLLLPGIVVIADSMRKIANEDSSLPTKIFSLIAMVTAPIALIMLIIGLWNPEIMVEPLQMSTSYAYSSYTYTVQVQSLYSKFISAFFAIAIASFFGSITLSLKDREEKIIIGIKYAAAAFLVVSMVCTVVAIFTVNLNFIFSFYSSYYNSTPDQYKVLFIAVVSGVVWLGLFILALYLSKFDNLAAEQVKPLNGHVVTESAPALISIEEEKPIQTDIPTGVPTTIPTTAPTDTPIGSPEPLYPEPDFMPKPHLEGQNLHANMGEPLHSLGGDDHPTIGPATATGDFDSFNNDNNEE